MIDVVYTMLSDVAVVRGIAMPYSVEGFTIQGIDGVYNVYINVLLTEKRQRSAIRHELNHIDQDHFNKHMSIEEKEACAQA
jgi:hypothetical protein